MVLQGAIYLIYVMKNVEFKAKLWLDFTKSLFGQKQQRDTQTQNCLDL